ncbi:hypothetical protein BDM02DRAFT_3185309 [Thelephora ganbajun]|uniref:Uncharacterized protein n=1 Tax=Thelephora ganbajun TaxID=370292 RepID=A0ACB6ZMU0_THEGA|nr:hypothetical protein BDM02DRAFT_3185309 [Thelephora ganbajun]
MSAMERAKSESEVSMKDVDNEGDDYEEEDDEPEAEHTEDEMEVDEDDEPWEEGDEDLTGLLLAEPSEDDDDDDEYRGYTYVLHANVLATDAEDDLKSTPPNSVGTELSTLNRNLFIAQELTVLVLWVNQ